MPFKAYLYAALLALAGFLYWSHGQHEFKAGVNSVTAAAAATDQAQAIKAQAHEQTQATGFVSLDATYLKATANAQNAADPFLVLADSGAYGLRPSWQCPSGRPGGSVTPAMRRAATTSSGRHVAAAGSAQYGITPFQSVLSAGHDADAREAQLRARIAYLEGLLQKEREP